jgi:hypothetical protein
MDTQRRYNEATIQTAENLRSVAQSNSVRSLSHLSLPSIEDIVHQVGKVIPAGNVPGVILNGMARLPGNRQPVETTKRDINLLFQGVEQVLDQAVYGTFFAGPAAIIWGYQNLLKLAGKDLEAAFPEGTWQFYADYALREDTARHANETHGFDTRLQQHHIQLSPTDRITAWVMAAIHCLHQYEALLANEWRERAYVKILQEVVRQSPCDPGVPNGVPDYTHLYADWEKYRPYTRGSDAASHDNYPTYRQIRFDKFMEDALQGLEAGLRRQWVEKVRAAKEQDLPAYQRQLSILAYLEPARYAETRTPLPKCDAHIGLIYQGHYYLIPACMPHTDHPAEFETVRAHIAAILSQPSTTPTMPLTSVVGIKRETWPNLRKKFSRSLLGELEALRLAPILLNCDARDRRLPLAELRQAERGLGSHALTLFDTGESMVFDQSHIFFDGSWGAALAEILTNEALAWAVYLNTLPPLEDPRQGARPTGTPARALAFRFQPAEIETIRQAPRVTAEASVETEAANVRAILALRKLFKRRNDLIQLTVNDLLVLYRAIHAATYQPAQELLTELQHLSHNSASAPAAQAALTAITPVTSSKRMNPAILIPVDASQHSPRDRLYPMTFEVPLQELDLLSLHARIITALSAYKNATGDRSTSYAEFDRLQRTYLAALAGFGAVLSQAKEIAISGKSASIGTIKMMAHLPIPLQRLLDQIPNRFDVLNDIVKGREVFSNVGAVAKTSSLTRFIGAKDDNNKKTLVWGVLTDAQSTMHLALRDFRPHVGLLAAIGRQDLAKRIAQDYLDAYANGLNRYIYELRWITLASRETRTTTLINRDKLT